MKKMNLAILTGSDIRCSGGSGKYVIELCKRLENYDVTVFSYKDDKSAVIEDKEIRRMMNAKLEYFLSFTLPVSKERIPLTVSGVRILSKLHTYNSIYVMDTTAPTLFMILLFLRLKQSRAKVILGIHDPGFMRIIPQKDTFMRRIMLRLYRPIYKRVVFAVQNMHVLNINDNKMLEKEGYKGQIYYIPNFLYYNKNEVSSNVGLNKKEFIVLFCGRLVIYQKGIDLLEEIVKKTLEKNKNIRFHIVGSGGDGQKLMEDLKIRYLKNVKYLGFIPNKQLEEEYKNASLYIMTSRIEAFPIVTLEAQSHGLPIISFDIKGPNDVIKKYFQGKLIKPFEIGDFVNAILEDYELWKEGKLDMTYKCEIIDYIFSKYSEERIIPRIKKMLQD